MRLAAVAGAMLTLMLLAWGVASLSGGVPKARAVPLDFIELNRSPAPPNCVNPGSVENFNWTIQFSSIPDHYVYSITNPLFNVVYGPFTVNIQGQPSPVTGSDAWSVPTNAMPGNYAFSIYYYSNFGLEATARVIFIVCAPPTRTPVPTNTVPPTSTSPPTNTPVPTNTAPPTSTSPPTDTPSVTPTATPACPTSVVIVTPAYTPGPSCSSTPPAGVLTAVITDQPTTTTALFTNNSSTCSYPIGLATYRKFEENPETQQLYDYELAVIPPHASLTLTVNNPTCAYQAYAFYGALLASFAGGASYGERLLDTSSGNGTNYCTSPCVSTTTPTHTATVTSTETPTRTPTSVPCNVCLSIVNNSVTISCNGDGMVHWTATVRNPGSCTANVNWKTQLQQHIPSTGGFTGATMFYSNSNFPPGDTVLSGDFCYNFPQNVNSIRVEFTIDQPTCSNGHNPHEKSPSIAPCPHTGGCGLSFQDVGEDSPYFGAVTFLNSARVVSGYADGTFRPYNNVTRGQAAKIVVLAFGLGVETVSRQRFLDVPAGDPFARYIETAYSHGLVSGYEDGTFRPGNTITRGQVAKIVVEAASVKLENPSAPTFSDVPASSAFYRYIETAYARGFISGYADGTFGPGAVATRGQVSKLATNAAYPPEE
ncbi:MAG: S-layer homology domain-containing protein [Chloroflexia bacterium]